MANPPATTAHPPVSPAALRTEWRSPPPETPLTASTPLPSVASMLPDVMSPPPAAPNDLLHPSFLPVCDHSDGDSHAHAFDLLSLAASKPSNGHAQGANAPPAASPPLATIPSSVPARSSYLSASRPPVLHHPSSNGGSSAAKGDASGSNPKPRRMSSSTTGVLQRGKLGLTGEASSSLSKDPRPLLVNHATSYSGTSPVPHRRPTLGTSPTPQLFDFAKTDRRPSHSTGQRPPVFASRSTSAVIPASLPVRSHIHSTGHRSHALPPPPPQMADDMELDMAFDGGDEEDPSEGERSGSAERDDMDMEGLEDDGGKVSALGQGSGGVKGRRKGMVFKCETCSKEYRHPSCLVKHRWEHSPHWKETAQLSMSKHQQVQMLEAAAILAHLDPGQGRALPNDKSLWPSVLSPPSGESFLRRPSRDLTGMRSTPSSSGLPLTPGSLRDSASFGPGKERKSSPDTDSTTSSMGAGEPYVPVSSVQPVGGAAGPRPGHRNSIASNGGYPGSPQAGGMPSLHPRHGSFSSSVPSTLTAHSVGSLPNQMASLRFGTTPTGASPITRPGMFGLINTARPSSSVRSGADDPIEDDEDDWNARRGGANGAMNKDQRGSVRGGKKSSEEAEEYSMAMDMEL